MPITNRTADLTRARDARAAAAATAAKADDLASRLDHIEETCADILTAVRALAARMDAAAGSPPR